MLNQQSELRDICLRKPREGEGLALQKLIAANPPLDVNSVYSYYLLSRHFADTCVVAEFQGEAVAFLSAYIIPNRPDTLFIWQVVVDPAMRGKRLAGLMLGALLGRADCRRVKYLESTVNPSNKASRRVFEAYAEEHGEGIEELPFLEENDFGEGAHESEILLRITLKQTEQHDDEVIYAYL